MNLSLFFACIIGMNLAERFSNQPTKEIVGSWNSEDQNLKTLIIYKGTNNLYYGKNEAGKIILKDLKYDEKSESFIGSMTPPDAKIELTATVTLLENGNLKVEASKFIMKTTMIFIKKK
jgi:hypothetical protein